MNLAQLNYFRILAQFEHYGKAAEQLYITQPSLSNSINNLEKEIGVPLFERVGRNVRLTEYGAEFNSHVCIALDEIDKAVEIMRAYKSGLKGRIRIGVIFGIQRSYLAPLLAAFKDAFGDDVVFDIYQDTTPEILSALDEGKLDVAFCGKLLGYKNLEFTLKVAQNLVVALNKESNLLPSDRITLEDLKNYALTTYRHDSYIGSIVKDFLSSNDIEAEEGFSDDMSPLALTLADKTVAALMLAPVDNYVDDEVSFVPIEGLDKAFHGIFFSYKKESFHSRLVEEFIRFTLEFSPVASADLIEDAYYDVMSKHTSKH